MTNFIELCEYFAIEEGDEGRFLIDNWSKEHKRLVDIGKDNEVNYINLPYAESYNFRISNPRGIGLMQLKSSTIPRYTDITGTKKCADNVLQLEDVLVIPTEYEEVSVDHIFERFGVDFPIARKNAESYDVFAKGTKLQNASGETVFLHMRESKETYIPQIISYRNNKVYVISEFDEVIFSDEYDKFPQLCFIQNADDYASICPSYKEYKLTIWMYNAKEKVGIVYLDDDDNVHRYIMDEIPFNMKDSMYFINENYLIYNFHDEKYLYFKGQYIGKIPIWFESETKHPIFLHTDKGVYLGRTFIDKEYFWNLMWLHVDSIHDDAESSSIKKITLRSGSYTENFKYDPKIDKVIK